MSEIYEQGQVDPLLVPLYGVVSNLSPGRSVAPLFGQALFGELHAMEPSADLLPYTYALAARRTIETAAQSGIASSNPLLAGLAREFEANSYMPGACDSIAMELALGAYGEPFMLGVRRLLIEHPYERESPGNASKKLEEILTQQASIAIPRSQLALNGLLHNFLRNSRL